MPIDGASSASSFSRSGRWTTNSQARAHLSEAQMKLGILSANRELVVVF